MRTVSCRPGGICTGKYSGPSVTACPLGVSIVCAGIGTEYGVIGVVGASRPGRRSTAGMAPPSSTAICSRFQVEIQIGCECWMRTMGCSETSTVVTSAPAARAVAMTSSAKRAAPALRARTCRPTRRAYTGGCRTVIGYSLAFSRQADREDGAASRSPARADGAAVHARDAAHDGQAQTGAFDRAVAGFVGAIKPVEHAGQGLVVDAHPGVPDFADHLIVAGPHGDVDGAAVGELDRIVDEIAEELAQQAIRPVDDCAVGALVKRKLQAFLVGLHSRGLRRFARDGAQIERLLRDLLAGIGLREKQHAAHHAR